MAGMLHYQCYSFLIYRSVIKGTVVLLPLLGLTWLFGLLTVNEDTTVFAWIFTILNSFQVCIMWCEWYYRPSLTQNS